MRAIYRGHVQGVGFRWTTARIASRFEVTGFVRNREDGSVELLAQGEAATVDSFLAEVAAAMRGHIERADVEELAVRDNLAGFQIAH
jgi:acylphosphatase